MTVKVSRTSTQVFVESPYNSLFVAKAKKIGGKFSGGVWEFDIRDSDRAVALCKDVYGSDGVTSDTCTIRVHFTGTYMSGTAPIEIGGFSLAKAFGRDSGAKLFPGIVVLEGGFDSGGSVKNWSTVAPEGTIALLRDFPRHRAEEYAESPPHFKIKVTIEDERPPVDVSALTAEKDRLLSRLLEIDELLSCATEKTS
jgi:hypothetical protein